MPSLINYNKTSYCFSQTGTHSFAGTSPLWLLMPGKAIKLLFPTSPKALWGSTRHQCAEKLSFQHPSERGQEDTPRILWENVVSAVAHTALTTSTPLQLSSQPVHLCPVTRLSPTPCDAMDRSPPGSSVHGVVQAKNWSKLPFPPPEDLPDPGIKPMSPVLQVDSLLLSHLGSPFSIRLTIINKKRGNFSEHLWIQG